MGGPAGDSLRELASAGFYDGLQAGCLVAGGVCLLGALAVLALLPSRPAEEAAKGDSHIDGLAFAPAAD